MIATPHTPLTFDERMAAIERTIDAYHVYIETYLESLTRNHADAQELANQLWLFALHKFKDEHLESLPILRRKAYQLFVDHHRKRKRREALISVTDAVPDRPALSREAAGEAEERALQERFWAEFPVEDLPATHKHALYLSARYGYTVQEISRLLGAPPSTIGDWLQSARRRLADHLNAHHS